MYYPQAKISFKQVKKPAKPISSIKLKHKEAWKN